MKVKKNFFLSKMQSVFKKKLFLQFKVNSKKGINNLNK